MVLDRRKLEHHVQEYLRSPAAASVFSDTSVGCVGNLIIMAIAMCGGLILLPTLIWTLVGLRMIWHAVSFAPFFDDEGAELRRDPSKLVPLITHGIIIGPTGAGLVLGSFDPRDEEDIAALARIARRLAAIYADGPAVPEDQPVYELLRDDTFRPYRRRPVPASHAEGKSLWLFDLQIDVNQAAANDSGDSLIACVATKDDKGIIVQIPWQVVQPAFQT